MTKWKRWRARMKLEATITSVERALRELSASQTKSWEKPSHSDPHPAPRDSPPPGLEKQYRELYSLLRPCMVERQRKSNVTALLMGMRGSGKTLLLERCLEAFQKETQGNCGRIIRLNGLVVRGDDVGFAVKEIVRQLSAVAVAETQQEATVQNGDCNSEEYQREQKRARRDEKLLRLRNSSFTSNLALLDEALRIACVDSMPVLIVLDEMDAFLGSNTSALEKMLAKEGAASVSHRQLLLYHLLDRVATQGSFLSLVGITSHLASVAMFEKRVKSRMEGTSKVIYVRPQDSFQGLVRILLEKFRHDGTDKSSDLEEDESSDREHSTTESLEASRLKQCISDIFIPPAAGDNGNIPKDKRQTVRDIMERQYKLGMDIRWFCRVMGIALSLYLEDCKRKLRQIRRSTDHTTCSKCPEFTPDHILQGLSVMGASFLDEEEEEETDFDEFGVSRNLRVQAIFDLSGPQLAVLLSARRVLARDSQKEDTPQPLTMNRIMNEYQCYRGSSNRYSQPLILSSFIELLETNVLRPSADHSGGGPLQYDHSQSYYAMDLTSMSRMPLHVPVEIDRELGEALKGNKLDCSTALREWAKKMN